MTTNDKITVGYLDESEKPLTRYLYKDTAGASPYTGTRTPAGLRNRRNAFRCPADSDSGIGRSGGPSTAVQPDYLCPGVKCLYEDLGTSYVTNRFFIYDPQLLSLSTQYLHGTPTFADVDGYDHAISKVVEQWQASRVYLATDIWFLWSIWYGHAYKGAHSTSSTHNMLFLDGHAASITLTQAELDVWGSSSWRYLHSGKEWSDINDPNSRAIGASMVSTNPLGSNFGFGTIQGKP